jgi:hypothetical protein
VRLLLHWLEAQTVFASVNTLWDRVVHAMKHSEPERVTPKLFRELQRITPHARSLPREIGLIEVFCSSVSHESAAIGAVQRHWIIYERQRDWPLATDVREQHHHGARLGPIGEVGH